MAEFARPTGWPGSVARTSSATGAVSWTSSARPRQRARTAPHTERREALNWGGSGGSGSLDGWHLPSCRGSPPRRSDGRSLDLEVPSLRVVEHEGRDRRFRIHHVALGEGD